MLSQDFVQSKIIIHYSSKRQLLSSLFFVVCTDNIIITCNHLATINSIKGFIHHTFSITDMCKLSYFLGIQVCSTLEGFLLSKRKFTKELSQYSGITFSRKTSTSLPPHVKLLVHEGEFYYDPAVSRSLVIQGLTWPLLFKS